VIEKYVTLEIAQQQNNIENNHQFSCNTIRCSRAAVKNYCENTYSSLLDDEECVSSSTLPNDILPLIIECLQSK